MKNPDAKYWSPYWTNPTVTSFGNLFPDNYDGVMLEFWQRRIRGDLHHVVDLACGNGALTWIGNDILNAMGGDARITGVDFATIDPFKSLKRKPDDYPRVTFIGSTAAEKMPFGDGSVDLVISQYGIEYSDFEQSVPEIGRVLHGSGRVAFILHDKESVIVKGATQHVEDFRTIFQDIRVHDLFLEMDSLQRTDKNPLRLSQTPAFQRLQAQINQAVVRIQLLLRQHPASSPIRLYMERLTGAFGKLPKKQRQNRRQMIEHARDALGAHIVRIDDLYNAALSGPERERLVVLLQQQGMTVTENEVLRYKDGDNFGIMLAATR